MKIYRHLDWLSITVPADAIWRNMFVGLDWRLAGEGRHGYKKHYVSPETGIECETDSRDAAMGTHFTVSGVPLAEWKAVTGETDDEICARIALMDGKVSRIDLTIDVWDCKFTAKLLARSIRNKSAKVKARRWRLISGNDRGIIGNTLDTGSPTSDKRFRLYDKNAEGRIKDKQAWQRLELQLRRSYAKNAAMSCAQNGTEATITGHIADTLHWRNDEYQYLLAADSIAPDHTGRTDGKRRKWLKGQVARALASEINLDEDFRGEFDEVVNYWIEKLTKTKPALQ